MKLNLIKLLVDLMMYFTLFYKFLVLIALVLLSSNQLSFLKYFYPFLSYEPNKLILLNFFDNYLKFLVLFKVLGT